MSFQVILKEKSSTVVIRFHASKQASQC